MNTLFQDLKFGLRMLAKNPGFTAVAVMTLALGIGASTAIFSAVNTVLLRGLPCEDPASLVALREYSVGGDAERAGPSYFNVRNWEKQTQAFAKVAYYGGRYVNLSSAGGEPERVTAFEVSEGYFPTLGVKPVLGRSFLPEECVPGRNLVVILDFGLWKGRFGGRPDIIGQTLLVEGAPATIIGVMPARFKERWDIREVQLWMPIRTDPAQVGFGTGYATVIARLRPGVTIERARAELAAIASRLREQYPEIDRDARMGAEPLRDWTLDFAHQPLLIMLAAVGLVLLIACANVAHLLLARGTVRRKELAVRVAVGASRWRLVRQLLCESFLLVLLGAAGGLLLAPWAVHGINTFSEESGVGIPAISVDARVLGFTLLLSLLTGIIFGLMPAMQTSKVRLTEALKDGDGEAPAGSSPRRLRSALVIGEVALSLILAIGAGLLARSLHRLLQVDPGFRTENVLTTEISLSAGQYPTAQRQSAFFRELLTRVNALPGVQSAGYTSCLPWSGFETLAGFVMEGHKPPPAEPPVIAWFRYVSPGYFRTMGIPLRKGELFTDENSQNLQRVIVVSETFARKYYPNQDPVGRRMNGFDRWWTIIGVVGDIKHRNLDAPSLLDIYLPQAKGDAPGLTLVLKTAGNPLDLAGAVRDAVREIDPNQPVSSVRTMQRVLFDRIAVRRLLMFLMGIFAAVALILAATGIYGVISYSVSQRTHEIGVRMALGARQRDVLKLVVRQGLLLCLAGVAIGLTGAFALTRFLASQLFGVAATDPFTFAGVAVLLVGVALLATYLPARRAMKVDPMVALRYE